MEAFPYLSNLANYASIMFVQRDRHFEGPNDSSVDLVRTNQDVA